MTIETRTTVGNYSLHLLPNVSELGETRIIFSQSSKMGQEICTLDSKEFEKIDTAKIQEKLDKAVVEFHDKIMQIFKEIK